MTKEEILEHTNKIIKYSEKDIDGSMIMAIEFLKKIVKSESYFLTALHIIINMSSYNNKLSDLHKILNSFKEYVNDDLLKNISLEREIQIETVSDYLEQAEKLLNSKNFHPASAAVIIGASLEEFLRNWLEELNEDMTELKLSLDSYSKQLRKRELISKQDLKDITSWAGIRNDAAHGNWDSVSDRNRIKLMLEGVNLFMRKYSS